MKVSNCTPCIRIGLNGRKLRGPKRSNTEVLAPDEEEEEEEKKKK
jgi:hypothetical protein